jgi:hypothetical protein
MKIYKKMIRPAYECETFVGRSCDLCGKKTKSVTDWSEFSYYEVNETEISINIKHKKGNCEKGTNCLEGENCVEYEVDLCPDCFKDKLVPWLQSQGAQIDKKELEW